MQLRDCGLNIHRELDVSRLSGGALDLTRLANNTAPFLTCKFAQLELFLPIRNFSEVELLACSYFDWSPIGPLPYRSPMQFA